MLDTQDTGLKEELPAHLQGVMENPPDSPGLPNVLIIGDSISIGYTVGVRKLLAGKADVFRPRPIAITLAQEYEMPRNG